MSVAAHTVAEPDSFMTTTVPQMRELIQKVRPLVENEPSLIKVEAGPSYVVGDLHGDFEALKYIYRVWKKKKAANIIFLGDYVDRGSQQLETINFVLAMKVLFPDRVFLLRGNHETPSVNSYYGFSSACRERFQLQAKKMYNEYNVLFSYFSPALLFKRILLLHGGIPKGISRLQEIADLKKGDLNVDTMILGQILWNDPSERHPGFEFNWARGIHYTYGEKVFTDFLETHHVDGVVRGHEVFSEGYKYFFDDRLLSIFSSPDYEMGNRAKIAYLSGDGKLSLMDVEVGQSTDTGRG
ncbi:MAG: metallophosphoesterase [Theionarchaea archaeon]|nr:metallophosphoesterase [Theionarchaea archaeon]